MFKDGTSDLISSVLEQIIVDVKLFIRTVNKMTKNLHNGKPKAQSPISVRPGHDPDYWFSHAKALKWDVHIRA